MILILAYTDNFFGRSVTQYFLDLNFLSCLLWRLLHVKHNQQLIHEAVSEDWKICSQFDYIEV